MRAQFPGAIYHVTARGNRRQRHLFQGRFHSAMVETTSHLLEPSRYVVLNPVRAGLCDHPASWPWSSYRATAGIAPVPQFLAASLLSNFEDAAEEARAAFVAFVADAPLDRPRPNEKWRGV
jgi:putative transposase